MQRKVFLVTTLMFAATEVQTPRPLHLPDILSWKHIQSPMVSNDGGWFAYKLVPNEGNSEVILRNLKDGIDTRYPIGELPAVDPIPGGGPPPSSAPPSRDVAISGDSKWAAFTVYPSARESQTLRKQHKPGQNKVVLVELATGKKTEFDKIRRFAFSGEQSTVIALHRYPPTPVGFPGAAPSPIPSPSGPSPSGPADEKPSGSDLILHHLATGLELNVGNVSDFAFTKSGNWIAWIIDAQDQVGNGIEVRNLATRVTYPLDNGKASYKSLNWTERGDGLAALRGVEDKGFEDKRYTLVAFRGFTDNSYPERVSYDPVKDPTFPTGMAISGNRSPVWLKDLSAVAFGIHELKPKKKDAAKDAAGANPEAKDEANAGNGAGNGTAPRTPARPMDAPDKPDLAIWNWQDKRLPPMQQIQESRDKNFSYLCLYRPATQKFLRLADEEVRNVNVGPESQFAVGVDFRQYERESNLDGKRFEDIYTFDLTSGQRKLALRKNRWVMSPSPDATQLLHYDEGVFYSYDVRTGSSRNLTKNIPAIFYDTEDDHNVSKPPTRTIGWSKDSSAVLLTDDWDIWKVPMDGGAAVNLTGNGKKDKIRYELRFHLDADEKGIDLAQPIYVRAYAEWTKKSGIGVIEPGQAGIRMLSWDDAYYAQLLKAKDAPVYLYSRETNQDAPNFYLSKASLETGQRVTDANPQQKNFLWNSGVKLINYTSDKGDKLQGALFLPANFQAGKTYPTVVFMYERLSQNANRYPEPAFNGFSAAAYTSNGYAVLEPDIVYKVNDPGMSAVWCVLPALKAAIATGVVDAKRVGLHGHSWGGYQTAFLVTQTNAFRAAIAGAPLTDLIAMYNAIYWNTGTTNQPIFESSQGRFNGSPMDNMEAYVRNSPVYHARNVGTPLLILHNDKDGAVDHTQGIEYYNTLRRLDKPVVMLEYKGENHGLRKAENKKDYTVRVKEFFDHFLMDAPAPKWWTEGVPLISMKEHLEEREKELTK